MCSEQYPLCTKKNKLAVVSWNSLARTPEEVLIVGSKGYLRIHSTAHNPTKITLSREKTEHEEFNFPLPPPIPLKDGSKPVFHFAGSVGLQYEAIAVQDCIRKGLTVCDVYPPVVSLRVMAIMDEVRKQIGLTYPSEFHSKL